MVVSNVTAAVAQRRWRQADEVEAALGAAQRVALAPEPAVDVDLPLRQAREQFERRYFSELLNRLDGNVNQAAQHAGVERTHLYRKLRALGIDAKQGTRRDG